MGLIGFDFLCLRLHLALHQSAQHERNLNFRAKVRQITMKYLLFKEPRHLNMLHVLIYIYIYNTLPIGLAFVEM